MLKLCHLRIAGGFVSIGKNSSAWGGYFWLCVSRIVACRFGKVECENRLSNISLSLQFVDVKKTLPALPQFCFCIYASAFTTSFFHLFHVDVNQMMNGAHRIFGFDCIDDTFPSNDICRCAFFEALSCSPLSNFISFISAGITGYSRRSRVYYHVFSGSEPSKEDNNMR